MSRPVRLFSIPVLLAAMAAGCGDDVVTDNEPDGTPTTSQVATVTVAPETSVLSVGDTLRLIATPRAAGGATLAGRVVAWSSETQAIATVSASGVVTGVAAGSVRIIATSESRTGSSTITVVQRAQ